MTVQGTAKTVLFCRERTNRIETFRGSSAVEQFPVKELVVGSIPTHGARKNLKPRKGFLIF